MRTTEWGRRARSAPRRPFPRRPTQAYHPRAAPLRCVCFCVLDQARDAPAAAARCAWDRGGQGWRCCERAPCACGETLSTVRRTVSDGRAWRPRMRWDVGALLAEGCDGVIRGGGAVRSRAAVQLATGQRSHLDRPGTGCHPAPGVVRKDLSWARHRPTHGIASCRAHHQSSAVSFLSQTTSIAATNVDDAWCPRLPSAMPEGGLACDGVFIRISDASQEH